MHCQNIETCIRRIRLLGVPNATLQRSLVAGSMDNDRRTVVHTAGQTHKTHKTERMHLYKSTISFFQDGGSTVMPRVWARQ